MSCINFFYNSLSCHLQQSFKPAYFSQLECDSNDDCGGCQTCQEQDNDKKNCQCEGNYQWNGSQCVGKWFNSLFTILWWNM